MKPVKEGQTYLSRDGQYLVYIHMITSGREEIVDVSACKFASKAEESTWERMRLERDPQTGNIPFILMAREQERGETVHTSTTPEEADLFQRHQFMPDYVPDWVRNHYITDGCECSRCRYVRTHRFQRYCRGERDRNGELRRTTNASYIGS